MKKVISVLLTVCILCGTMLYMTSCNLFKAKIDSGTEAAKLLLANERLDENLLNSKIDVGISKSKKSSLSAKDTAINTKLLSASPARLPVIKLNNSGSSYTWKDFPAASSSLTEFNQFMNSVDHEVQGVAEDIANMKKNVGVTDKWVKFIGGEKQMLRVFENYDCLLVYGIHDDVHVYYRFTDESARNYYEMYSLMSYDDGTTGNIKTLYIPNERYEYMYENSNGFVDYFIAERSRGYWVNTRFSVNLDKENPKSASFSTYIIKDGLGYGFYKSYHLEDGEERHECRSYDIFDPNTGRELFRIVDGGEDRTFELYFSAIKNGFVSVSATDFYEDVEEGIFNTNAIDTLTTSKGVYKVSKGANENGFNFTGGYTQYFFGENIYYGSASFTTKKSNSSMHKTCMDFGEYAKSLGLELYCDMETVAYSLEHATLMADVFEESFNWNGYVLSDISQIEAALKVLSEDYAAAHEAYDEVKDFEEVSLRQVLSKDAHFAALNVTSDGQNRMDGTSIKIDDITVGTDDVALFENGLKYVVKIGLALVDENDTPISVNTVALSGSETTPITFEGNAFTGSVSGEYAIPKNLLSGRYAAVVYVATADEGIRVSELKKIAFVEIKEGEIESAAMIMEAFNVDSHLIISYKIKNTRTITVSAAKEAYTYEEAERMVMTEILTYGAPFHDATLETQTGEKLDPSNSIKKGTYRMMCYINTADGLAQGYVYLILE